MTGWVASLFRTVGVKDGVIAGLVLALIFAATQWHKASTDAANLETAYSHPQIKYVDRVIEKQGPVRIKTVIVKEPSGDEVTTIEEERGAAETVSDTRAESVPVPVANIMTPTRTDRYLLTLGVNRLTADVDGKAVFVGYGWRNRFDLQVGGVEHAGFSPWLLATARF